MNQRDEMGPLRTLQQTDRACAQQNIFKRRTRC